METRPAPIAPAPLTRPLAPMIAALGAVTLVALPTLLSVRTVTR